MSAFNYFDSNSKQVEYIYDNGIVDQDGTFSFEKESSNFVKNICKIFCLMIQE